VVSMRDKIEHIIWEYQGSDDRTCFDRLADAIIAALPEMIPDLVWEAGDGLTASEEYLRATSLMDGKYWTMEGELSCSFDTDTFDEAYFNSETEAKAAANAHHRASIMAAFTGETT
jgi:hypothetical protein